MNKYYVHYNGSAWFVKDADFFVAQGGLTDDWGKGWHVMYADSIEHARDRAQLKQCQEIGWPPVRPRERLHKQVGPTWGEGIHIENNTDDRHITIQGVDLPPNHQAIVKGNTITLSQAHRALTDQEVFDLSDYAISIEHEVVEPEEMKIPMRRLRHNQDAHVHAAIESDILNLSSEEGMASIERFANRLNHEKDLEEFMRLSAIGYRRTEVKFGERTTVIWEDPFCPGMTIFNPGPRS